MIRHDGIDTPQIGVVPCRNENATSIMNDITASGHQLVTCPLAKGTLATWSLDPIFRDVLVPRKPLRSFFNEVLGGLYRVSRVRDLVLGTF